MIKSNYTSNTSHDNVKTKAPQPNSSELELVARGVFQTITNSTRYLNPGASLQTSS